MTEGGATATGTATVLFTDLVDSTELWTQAGDGADELRRTHDRLLAEAVTASNGTVVKSLGDGIMATFPAAADAVSAAVAIQQATDGHNRRSASSALVVRVGVSVGDVTWDNGDCFGAPVVEASRLCGAAEGGQILVAELVRGLARGRGGHAFVSVGELDLKGLPEPVPACDVGWEPMASAVAGESIPLPALLEGGQQFAFAGRDTELEQLITVWKEAAEGERRVVLVAGEPGIGKTRLAAETARVAHDRGATVLYGRCDDELGMPFQPFVEALEYFVAHAPGDGLRERLGRHAGELVRLTPDLTERVGDLPAQLRSDADTERYRMFDAVAAWLAAASEEQPIVLVVDDLHWAAKPTLLLLRHVLRSSDPARLLIIGTYRDTDLDRTHPLSEMLADLRRTPGVERLALGGLEEEGVADFLERAAGHALGDDGLALAHALYLETDGNPFFVGEVLRHLSESGTIYQRDGRWVSDSTVEQVGIPEGVREVIGRRLNHLSDATNRVLTTAAVIGRDFDLEVLTSVADVDENAVLAALDEAVTAQLVEETGIDTYRFAHALVRSTLYDEVSASRRVRWHRQIGETIEAGRPGDVAALAYHFMRAAPGGEFDKAIEFTTRAGDEALLQLAHDQAAVFYGQALDLLDTADTGDDGQRCELLIRLGDAQRLAGVVEHRDLLLEAARLAEELGDAERLGRAALANNRGWFSQSGEVDRERVAVLEAALAAIGPSDSAMRARLLGTLGMELVYAGDRPRRVALSDEAVAMARRLGDASTLVTVLGNRTNTVWAPETVPDRLAASVEQIALAEQLGDPLARFYSLSSRAVVLMESGDGDGASELFDEAVRVADELGQPQLRWQASWNGVWRAALAGRSQESEERAGVGLELGEAAGQPDALPIYAAQLYQARWDQGRLGEVEPILAQTAADNPGLPAFRAALALIYCELDRDDEARQIFEVGAGVDFTDQALDATWLTYMVLSADVCAQLGAAEPAAVLYERLARWHAQIVFNGVTVLGSVARYLGLLATTMGHFGDAETHFAEAQTAHERIGAVVWVTRTQVDQARMLVTRGGAGDVERARERLEAALAVARDIGQKTVERRAAALLDAL